MRVGTLIADSGARMASRARGSLSWGFLFLLGYAAVSVGRIQELIPALAPLRIGLLSGGLAFIVWSQAPGSWREKVPLEVVPVKYVMMLLGLAVLIVPIGIWPRYSLMFIFGSYLKTILLFLLVIYWCRSLIDIRRLLWVCCLITAALVVPGALSGTPSGERYHFDSMSYDPNDLALLLVMTLPLVLYLFSTSGRLAKFVLVVVALLCLYGVVLTQSRGGLLSLITVGALIFWRNQMSRSSKLIVGVVAVIVFGVLAGTAYKERIATMWNPQDEYDRTAGGRTDIWKTGLMLMATHPWGVGIDAFVIAEGLSHGGFGKWNAPHNSFLQVGVELGIVGLIVFVRLLAHIMKDLRRMQAVAQPDRRTASPSCLLTAARRSPMSSPQVKTGDIQGHVVALAAALEISLWGFIVGGFFLSLAYSSLLYVMLALSLSCRQLLPAPVSETRPGIRAFWSRGRWAEEGDSRRLRRLSGRRDETSHVVIAGRIPSTMSRAHAHFC